MPKWAQIVGASDLLDVTCAPSIPHALGFGSLACKDPFFVAPRNLVGVFFADSWTDTAKDWLAILNPMKFFLRNYLEYCPAKLS